MKVSGSAGECLVFIDDGGSYSQKLPDGTTAEGKYEVDGNTACFLGGEEPYCVRAAEVRFLRRNEKTADPSGPAVSVGKASILDGNGWRFSRAVTGCPVEVFADAPRDIDEGFCLIAVGCRGDDGFATIRRLADRHMQRDFA